MNIALDATYGLGENLSGVGVYSRELLSALAELHPEQSWTCYYRPHRYLRSLRLDMPRKARRLPLIENFGSRSDTLFHGLNQRLPARRFSKQIATFHDLFVLTGEYSTPEFRRRFAEQARHAAAEADLIIAVSEFTAGQIHELLAVKRARLRVIHHGVRALPASEAVVERREKVVLNVGAIQARKNVARLVRAFESAPADWKLVLAGSSGFGSEAILNQIAESRARERILVTGYVSPAELARWYARAAIFAFPSLDEGFGMPVLEAMSAGVPVIASNRSALPEVCGDAAVLVSPENEEELRESLIRLIADENLRETMISRGREHAAKFTWKRAAEQTWSVYSEVIGLQPM